MAFTGRNTSLVGAGIGNLYKVTWNSNSLRDTEFNVHDLKDYLINSECEIKSTDSESILLTSKKTSETLFEEIKKTFKINTYFIQCI